ncbi:hypothetical protein Pdw03_2973 [Penicillium digitatum]|uniref:Uncharacterized protein n=1 Tax=Penicillium digitatum TaxID=36651 RepID=A0A7T6XFD3_PENDI|nr:hypothetical protein Pdw03_2973 [Penicillium digitatum]
MENEILLAVVETNKWQHRFQDKRLALQRITHKAEDSNAASYLNPRCPQGLTQTVHKFSNSRFFRCRRGQ